MNYGNQIANIFIGFERSDLIGTEKKVVRILEDHLVIERGGLTIEWRKEKEDAQ